MTIVMLAMLAGLPASALMVSALLTNVDVPLAAASLAAQGRPPVGDQRLGRHLPHGHEHFCGLGARARPHHQNHRLDIGAAGIGAGDFVDRQRVRFAQAEGRVKQSLGARGRLRQPGRAGTPILQADEAHPALLRLKRFPPKWTPVRRKKARHNNGLETPA